MNFDFVESSDLCFVYNHWMTFKAVFFSILILMEPLNFSDEKLSLLYTAVLLHICWLMICLTLIKEVNSMLFIWKIIFLFHVDYILEWKFMWKPEEQNEYACSLLIPEEESTILTHLWCHLLRFSQCVPCVHVILVRSLAIIFDYLLSLFASDLSIFVLWICTWFTYA